MKATTEKNAFQFSVSFFFRVLFLSVSNIRPAFVTENERRFLLDGFRALAASQGAYFGVPLAANWVRRMRTGTGNCF